jgi:lysozyme family protein
MAADIGKSTDRSTATHRSDVSGSEAASFRYCNPGAQYPSERAARFGQTGYGKLKTGHMIARFPSPVNGAAANFDLLSQGYVGMTMGAAGKKWTGSYGFGIPGYPDDMILTKQMLDDPKLAIAILKAIAGRESGKGNNLTEEQWQQAHKMFKAGSADAFLAGGPAKQEEPTDVGTPTGAGLLRRAKKHIGEEYANRLVPKDDPNWKGPWDCAEFMSWLVYQEAGILYGCVDDNAKPATADAYTGAWQSDVERRGRRVSVDEAAATVGGILLRYPPTSGAMGHIALCDGMGGTVEAKGRKYGVVADIVHNRRWDAGVLVPGIKYEPAAGMTVRPAALIYKRNAPNMNSAIITRIQKALAAKGCEPGEIDGEFGPATEAAVLNFQRTEGLVQDGEVGPDTAAALGISLSAPPSGDEEPPAKETAGESTGGKTPGDIFVQGVGMMNPLVGIAMSFFPDIAKFLVGDKAGAIAGAVKKAVTDVTRTDNPKEARQRLETDPNAATELQLKLAQIAADQQERLAQIAAEQEEKRQKAQLDQLTLRYQDLAKERETELQTLSKQLENTKEARANLRALTGENPWIAATAPALSYIVTLGFFIILLVLLRWNPDDGSRDTIQMINIVIGALVAAFATVVNFWLGSSQSSQKKDERQEIQSVELIKKIPSGSEVAKRAAAERKPAAEATKPSNKFDRCVEIVMGHEEDKHPSGTARFGITLEELQLLRDDPNLAASALNALPREEACELYRARYWNVLQCDELPVGVDLVVFDFGVDEGAGKSAKALQEVVGAKADYSIGPATIAAAKAMSPEDVVRKMSQRRTATQASKDRIDRIHAAAREMIAAGSAGTA